MSMTIPDFWRLVIESRLLTAQQCQQLGTSYGNVRAAAGQQTARTLAAWLTAEGALSRYQATVLLSGRTGPFFYGEYRVHERIEAGRFLGYFRAHHVPTNHPVLLQFLAGPAIQDPPVWSRLATAVQLRFAHPCPNLLRYYDLVDTGTFRFLVVEDLAGRTLYEQLAAQGRLAPTEACGVMREIVSGLSWLHQLGNIHGEISSREVWLTTDGPAKLLHDPMRAPRPLADYASEPAEQFLARLDYAAPELSIPHRPPDPLSDIYALGCVFFEALTGQPPFAGGSAQEKITRHATQAIQPLEPLGIPPAVSQVVAYMMAKNPSVRFPQPQLVADQLAPFSDAAHLRSRAASELPTHSAYDHHLRQRSTAGLPSANPVPGIVGGVGSSPGSGPVATVSAAVTTPIPTGVPVGRAVAQTAAVTTASTAADAATSTRRVEPATTGMRPVSTSDRPRAPSATQRLREGRRPRQNQQAILLGSLGVAAVAVLIVIVIVATSDSDPSKTAGQSHSPPHGVPSNGDSGLTPTANSGTSAAAHANSHGAEQGTTGSTTAGTPPDKTAAAGPAGESSTAPEADVLEQVVPDDGALLWASPTQGPPLDISYVPLDAQWVLHVRPAELLAGDEGPRFIQACGPALQQLISQWEQAAGVGLNQVHELIFTLHDNGDDWPRPAVVVRLEEPRGIDELLEKWGSPTAVAVKDEKIFQGGTWSYYVPSKSDRVFVMGGLDDVKQVAEQHGAPPPLRRELGILRRLSDANRHLTLLANPNFITTNLLRDGRTYYFGEAKRLRAPVDWLLRDELQAVMWSLHLGEETYLEMRMVGTQGKDRITLAKEVRNRLAEIPDLLFEYIATLGSNPYWERIRLRYPGMINFVHAKSRIGADPESATMNCLLPQYAAHNLAFGAEMVLVSTPGTSSVASKPAGTSPDKLSPAKMTLDDVMFKHKTSMSFEAQSLEFAIQDIAKDVNDTLKGLPFEFKIKIMGEDLQLDGITRNQTVRDFMHKDKTVAEVLTAMVMKANAPNVPDPSMPEQKLLWVIDKDPDDPTKPIVLVTTRQQADKKKYTLPPAFRPK